MTNLFEDQTILKALILSRKKLKITININSLMPQSGNLEACA
jgi:hypothetical protein